MLLPEEMLMYGHILPNTAICRFSDLHDAQSLTRDTECLSGEFLCLRHDKDSYFVTCYHTGDEFCKCDFPCGENTRFPQ